MTSTSPSPTTTSPDTTAPDTTAPDTTAPGTVATFRAAELAVTTAPATGSDRDVAWLSPRQAPFEVAGFGWFAEEGVYRRLPQRSPWPLRPEVDRKADATAGGQLRFTTDSTVLAVRMSLTGAPTMNQMAPTGQAGVDAYVSEQNADGSWTEPRFWAVARPAVDAAEYERVLLPAIPAPEHGLRMITLNLPLYLGVTEVEVGLAPESQVAAPRPFAVPGRVVFYGTSITTGGCATRPGMTYPSILGRRLDQEVINLGFPGDGKGDPEVARLLGQLDDVACHVLDYETNVLETEKVRTTLTDFIPILREARPEVPILVITKARCAREAYDAEQVRSRLERRDIQLEIVERHRAAGDEHVHFLDLGHLDMAAGTVDGLHPTDLGFTWYADAIEPKLRRILGGDTSR